jgi:Fe2+ transport system protein FeoA
MKTTLYKLPLGQKATIVKINTPQNIKERLHTFGLIRNVAITPVKTTPLGCPRIYQCLNASIAIRGKIAKQIEVNTV